MLRLKVERLEIGGTRLVVREVMAKFLTGFNIKFNYLIK